MIELRREGLSTYKMSARLAGEGCPLNRTSVGEILSEEGFGRLLGHPGAARAPHRPPWGGHSPAAHGKLDFGSWPATTETSEAGLLLLIPGIWSRWSCRSRWSARLAIPAPGWCRRSPWLLSLLALKLTRTSRVSHVQMTTCCWPIGRIAVRRAKHPAEEVRAHPHFSYRAGHDHQRRFLAALDKGQIIRAGWPPPRTRSLTWTSTRSCTGATTPPGEALVSARSPSAARSVLTFFAQDTGTHNLVYANANVSEAEQTREVIALSDRWKTVSGNDPAMLIMDQKVHHPRRARRTRRARHHLPHLGRQAFGRAPVKHIDTLTGTRSCKTITLDQPASATSQKVAEATGIRLTG